MYQAEYPIISIFELEKDEFFENHFPGIVCPTLKKGSVYIVQYKLSNSDHSTYSLVDSCGDLVIVQGFTQEHLLHVFNHYNKKTDAEKIDLCKWFPKTIQKKVLTSHMVACPVIHANQLNAMNIFSLF